MSYQGSIFTQQTATPDVNAPLTYRRTKARINRPVIQVEIDHDQLQV